MYNIPYNNTLLFSQNSNFNVWEGTQTTRHFKILRFPCSAGRHSEEAVVGESVCAALFKWSGRAQRVIGATEGREEESSLQRETRNMTSVTLRRTWPVSEDRSREGRPAMFCVSWLLAQGQYSAPMSLTCSSLQCGAASHCAR